MMAGEFDLSNYGLCSFSMAGSAPVAGLAIDGKVIALRALQSAVDDRRGLLAGSVFDLLQLWDDAWPMIQRGAEAVRRDLALAAIAVPAAAVRLQAPVQTPGTIFCAGANYRKHLIEITVDRFPPAGAADKSADEIRVLAEAAVERRLAAGEPYFFIKNRSALVGPQDDIPAPALASEMDWELELAVVIGRRAWCVAEAEALDHVAGYTILHDVSTRDRMFRTNAVGADYVQAKGLKGFCPLGPYMVPRQFVEDPRSLRILLELNGQPMQDEYTSDMLFPIEALIAYLSRWIALEPGDIVATGSPAGNGTKYGRYLRPGDRMTGSITGLGSQSNLIINESRPARKGSVV